MPISNILPIDQNPASIVLGTMPHPARPYSFDVEFHVAGLGRDVKKFHYYATEADKPKFDFNYEEINQYGYRYHLLTGIRYPELSMTLMDDSDNKSLGFLQYYLNQAISGEMKKDTTHPFSTKHTRFNNDKILPTLDTDPLTYAGVNPLGQNSGTGVIIQQIKLYQYVSYGLLADARGHIRIWTFQDPQILNIDMSAFNTEEDGIGTFTITYNYKNVSMEVDGKHYPDTPFDLLRAAKYADLAEGALTTPPSGYIKAATNIGSQAVAGTINTQTNLQGVSGGAVAGLAGKTLLSTSNPKSPAIAPEDQRVAAQKKRNGYVAQLPAPLEGSVSKSAPAPSDQASKLSKIS